MFNKAAMLTVLGAFSPVVITGPVLAQDASASVYLSGTSRLAAEELETLRGREDVGGDLTSTTESTANAAADNGSTSVATTGSFNTSQTDDVEQDQTATNESTFTGDNAQTGMAYVGEAMHGMAGFANVLVNSGINSNLQGTIGVTINLH